MRGRRVAARRRGPASGRGAALGALVPVGVIATAALLGGCEAADDDLGAPVVVAESGASNPTVATDPTSGIHYVAWVGAGGHASDVWLRAIGRDGEVGPVVRVNDEEGDAAPHLQAPAQVAVGPEGNVYVAWTNNTVIEGARFPASDLRFARSTDGGRSFEPALTVNDDAGGPPASHTFHDLLVTGSGDVVVSWLDGRSEPGPDVRVAVSEDGGVSFGGSRIADHVTCPCCRTSMAVTPDGTLFVSWREIFEGDVRDIVVARSTDGGASWDEPERVHADDWVFPGCPHAGPSLAVDPSGTLHVAWYTGKPEAPGLYYATSSDAAETFSDPVTLLADAWVPPSQVSLVADEAGTLRAVWEDRRLEEPGFRYARVGGGALEPEHAEELIVGTNPALSSGAGSAVLAWLDGDRVLARTTGSRP